MEITDTSPQYSNNTTSILMPKPSTDYQNLYQKKLGLHSMFGSHWVNKWQPDLQLHENQNCMRLLSYFNKDVEGCTLMRKAFKSLSYVVQK